MSERPEALRLADCLDGNAKTPWTREEAAAELRRQHAEIEQLREQNTALDAACAKLEKASHKTILVTNNRSTAIRVFSKYTMGHRKIAVDLAPGASIDIGGSESIIVQFAGVVPPDKEPPELMQLSL